VHLHLANRAEFVVFQIPDDAGLAKRMKALDDGGGVDVISSAKRAYQLRVQVSDLQFGDLMHDDCNLRLIAIPLLNDLSSIGKRKQ